MTLADLDALLIPVLGNSRAASPSERYLALNQGYREVIRTILDVRADHFLVETGDVTIPTGKLRIALTGAPFAGRPVIRIRKIVSLGPDATGRIDGTNTASGQIRRWTPRAISSREFAEAELANPQDAPEVFYDLVQPLGVPTLAVAPALASDDTPLISAIYQPPRLSVVGDVVEPIVEQHIEVVLAYAMEWLLRAVNDADADRWGADAVQHRSHLIQHIAPKIEQQTQAVGSALWDMGSD